MLARAIGLGCIFWCAQAFALDSLEAEFYAPPPGYGEVPFWWWTGEKLDQERIAWQLEELHRLGVSGTQVNYSHLMSDGWTTAPVEPKIFSDDWWKMFNFAAEKSAALGMGIGLSCYTLDWPGGKNLFTELGINSTNLWACSLTGNQHGQVSPVVRRFTFNQLHPESGKLVIDRFFRPFWERVSVAGRPALNYFFQDELRLRGDWLWCEDFPEEFRKRKGYDVVPKLSLLFSKVVTGEVARVRLDYNDVMMDLAEERYFKPIYDWHASRGLIYACDPCSRGYNPTEYGDYMRAISWYTAPGFDTPYDVSDVLKCKMGSSIAHIYQRPRVWLEGYHSLGWHAKPEVIFATSAKNYAYGANLLNLHGLYYTTYGGWWEWAPPCYHFRQPYWTCLGALLKYFERLSYLLTRGHHVCDVAILSPQAPCLVDRARASASSVKLSQQLVKKLAEEGATDCDFIDDRSLALSRVEKDDVGTVLSVAGEHYRVLILPDMFVMRETSQAKVNEFVAAGGRVIDAKSLADVNAPLLAQPDVAGHPGLKVHHRRTATHDIYYFVDWNFTDPIQLRTKGTLEFWDPWTGKPVAEPRRGEPVLAVVKRALKGGAKAPHVVIHPPAAEVARTTTLKGPWRVTLKPTMDNRWGDFRLPATKELIGAEVRAMHWVEGGRTEVLGYGPQFLTNRVETAPYEFSWRYGVFGKPVNQDKHHGLNERVGDTFLIMGPYTAAVYYDMTPKADETNLVSQFSTFVYAPTNLTAQIVGEVERPYAVCKEKKYAAPRLETICVDGALHHVGEIVALKAGYTPIQLTTRGCGRAALVFLDASRGASSIETQSQPLSMKWSQLDNRLAYDPYGGRQTKGTFTATVPKGTIDAKVEVYGTLLRKEIQDGKLTVEVEYQPGFVGGNAFKGEIQLVVKPFEMDLGDWARIEGLRCYSGGLVYEKEFECAAKHGRILLDLGQVGSSAAVRVNEGVEHIRIAPPWTIDITDEVRTGQNRLSVTVYNTLNNHYQTIPTRYKTLTENCPSGLLGPVTLNEMKE